MRVFPKRRFHGVGEFWREARALWGLRKEIQGIQRGRTMAPKFRERLMLAVTSVNKCRYCSFAHTRLALKEGVAKEDIACLFQGDLANVPERERTAILYAQHWAENKGRPDADAVEKLKGEYGDEAAARIDATVRFINLNNLAGNTFDWFLHTVTFGLLGGV